MENIKYILVVRLVEHSICVFPKEREVLYPFNNIEIIANEIQICPFCGRPVQAFNCKCKDFQTNLVKIQNFYGDGDHKSRLHSSNINFRVVLSKPTSDFQVRILEKNEILDLGTDFWDFISTQVDSLSARYYKVSPVIYDDNEYFFVCKDLISKSVYRFKVPPIEYKPKRICLGIYEKNTVTNLETEEKRLGNYYYEHYWKDLILFEDWNDLCRTIKNFQNLI